MTIPVRPATRPTGPPAPPAGRGARRSWHLRANAVVLAYVALAALTVVLHDWPALPMPRWLAVHLLLLGAATNAIVTWTEHFAVTMLRARQPSHRAAAGRLAALNLAVLGVLVGVGGALAAVTVASATLLGAVVLSHLGSLLRIARHALMGRFAGTVKFYVVAGIALVASITFGTLVGVHAVSDRWREPLLAAHVHANVFGWVGLTVLGTLFTLWPTLLHTPLVDQVMRTAKRCLALTTTGLVVAVTGLAADLRWVGVAGLAVYAAGVVVALQPFVATWRRKGSRLVAAWSMAAGTGWLAVGVVADLMRLATAPDLSSYLPRLEALVPPLAVGFVLQSLLGALTYLLPKVRGGGPAGVRAGIERLSHWWRVRVVALNAGGLLVAVSGALTVPTVVPALGWALVVASVVMFLWLVLGGPVRPSPTRPALGGVALGLVMTLVPVAIAVWGQDATTGPASVSLHGAGGVQEVAVSLVSMDIRPGVIEVPAGTRLRLVVTNHDGMPHDLAFSDGRATPMLAGGRSATLNLGTLTANRSGWCTVPGHREAGMTLDIRVTGSGGDTAGGHQGIPAMTGGMSSGLDVHGAPEPAGGRTTPAPGWGRFTRPDAPVSVTAVARQDPLRPGETS
jgi:nitrite reductase (NO-forming)